VAIKFQFLRRLLTQRESESEVTLSEKTKVVQAGLTGGTREKDGRHPSDLVGGR